MEAYNVTLSDGTVVHIPVNPDEGKRRQHISDNLYTAEEWEVYHIELAQGKYDFMNDPEHPNYIPW